MMADTSTHGTSNPQPLHGHKSIRRAARGSALNLVGAGVSAVASFGLTVLVAHGTTRAAAGVFFSATSLFVLLASVAQLGTPNGLVYFIARAKTLGQAELHRSYLRVAIWPVILCAVGMAAALFIFAPQVAALVSPDHQKLATESIRVLAWFIPLAGIEKVVLSATRGLGTMRPNTVIEQVLRPGLQIVLAALILFANLHLNLSWSWAIPYGIASVLGWMWLRRLLFCQAPYQSRVSVAGDFWKFTAPRSVVGVAQIAMQRLDILLVGALAGAPAAALYTAATRFVVLGQMTRQAVSLAIQPHLAGAIANKTRATVNRLYQLSTAWLMAVSWPVYLVMLIDASPLLDVFGRNYGAATTTLMILAVSMLVATLCGDVDVMLIMSGRSTLSMINFGIALGANLGLDLWLIPRDGIKGAAIGWSVAIMIKNLAALGQVASIFRMHPIGRGTIVVALSSVISFLGLVGASRVVLGDGPVGFFAGGAAGCAVYTVLLWHFRDELELRAFLSSRRQVGSSTTGPSS